MQQNLLGYYHAIEEISRKMLDAAKAEDWDTVVRFEGTCAVLIEQLRHQAKSEALNPGSRAEKAKIMQRILRIVMLQPAPADVAVERVVILRAEIVQRPSRRRLIPALEPADERPLRSGEKSVAGHRRTVCPKMCAITSGGSPCAVDRVLRYRETSSFIKRFGWAGSPTE